MTENFVFPEGWGNATIGAFIVKNSLKISYGAFFDFVHREIGIKFRQKKHRACLILAEFYPSNY